MKTKILFLSLMTTVFAVQTQAQDRNRVYAMNNEISDNLDLRAVASIFGDSRNLQDFERRLNDPKIQISNLDLNYDDEVDYLRVIETVDRRTHVIIIQSVLDRDVYQDVATIDVEKDNYNNISVQIVGNEYMYGQNYIYEPVYYSKPIIYASFWTTNYRPYVSNWYWNSYPSYYYAWNPYPVFRYRNNVNLCVNVNNNYNYVNYRRSNQAVVLYNTRRCNSYEREHPNYAFSRRNGQVTNRYELDRRRQTRNFDSRNEIGYYQNRNKSSRNITDNKREYTQNSVNTSRENAPQRTDSQRDYSQNRVNTSRENMPQRNDSQRDYSQNRASTSRDNASQKINTQRDSPQNRANTSRESAPQRTETQRSSSQNRMNTSKESTPQRTDSQRSNSSRDSNNRRS